MEFYREPDCVSETFCRNGIRGFDILRQPFSSGTTLHTLEEGWGLLGSTRAGMSLKALCGPFHFKGQEE